MRHNKVEQFAVTYEQVPNPDTEALARGFAMLFDIGPNDPLPRFDKSRERAIVRTKPHS